MNSTYEDNKALQREEEVLLKIALKYKAIFDSNMDAVVCTDMGGIIFSWNPQAEKLFGWKTAEVLGKTVAETIVPPEYRERHLKGMQRYHDTNEGHLLNKIIEISAIDRKGYQFPVELTIIPLSENGKRFFCGFIRDISERKKAEENERKNLEHQKILAELVKAVNRVQKQEEIYELTLNGLQESIGADKASVLLFDENKVMQFVACRNLSIQYKKAVVGHSPWKADDIDITAIFISDVSKEPSLSSIMPDIHREGICSLGFIPLLHQQQFLGKLMVYFTTVHHFTEEEIQLLQNIASNIAFAIWEKKSEITLKESEAKYRAFFENSMDGILLTAPNGDVLAANPAVCEMFRMTEQEICLAGRTGLVDKDDPRLLPLLQGRSEKGKIIGELNFIRKDGSKFSAELSSSVFIDANGTEKTSMIIRDITERKKAEYKIKESEQKYRTLMQQAGDSILLFSGSGQLIEANQSARQLLGYSMEEYKNMLLKDLFFEEDIKKSPLRFDLLNKGESTVNRRRLRRKDGTAIETEIHAKKLSDGRYLGVARDLTERIKAEEQLRESEEKYRTLVEQASDGILVTDLQGTIVDMNSRLCDMFGYLKEEAVNKNVIEFLYPENVKKQPLRFNQLFGDQSLLLERVAMHRDGTIFDIELNTRMIGENMALSVIRNISERKRAEQLLKESEEKYRTLVEQASDPIMIYSLDGKILDYNHAFMNATGYQKENLEKMSLIDLLFEGDLKSKPIVFGGIKMGFAVHDERRIKRKDGSAMSVELNSKMMPDGNIMVIGRDITERKKAEKELEDSYSAIRRLTDHLQNIREEERAHIAREIHDELGQQLTVMKMDISWINKKIAGSIDAAMKEKTKELMTLLDQTVKTVRRISSELRPSLLDDLGLTAAMEWQLHEFGRRSGIETSLEVPPIDIKLSDSYKTGLFRIFQESLTNVARHSNASQVNVMLSQTGNKLILSITDDGKGFDKQKIAEKKTLGILGMKERTSMIGGSYEITSTPGKGTVVVVTIPLIQQ